MKIGADSIQFFAFLGAVGGYMLGNYDKLAAAACSLTLLAYTLWKWYKRAQKEHEEPAKPTISPP